MELYHHGILGQKWGVRRYQNKDGSLTAEGIKRYKTDLKFKEKYDKYSAKQEAKTSEKRKQKELKRVDTLMKKDPRKLTDEELAERIRRLDMEKRVSDLERSVNSSSNSGGNNSQGGDRQVNAGKNFIKRAGVDLLNTTTKLAVNYAAKKIMKNIFADYTDDSDKNKSKGQSTEQTQQTNTTSENRSKNKQATNKSMDDGQKLVSEMIKDLKDVKRDWSVSDRTITVGKDHLDNIWDSIKDTSNDWGSVTSFRDNGSDNLNIGGYDFTFDRGQSKSKWMV